MMVGVLVGVKVGGFTGTLRLNYHLFYIGLTKSEII